MREIKFRAWFSEDNELGPQMVYFGLGDIGKSTHKEPLGCGHGCLWVNGKDGNLYGQCIDCVEVEDHPPIMQYTGLKDRNGREIYEGDIVAFKVGRGVVTWDDGSAGFVVENKLMAVVHFEETEIIGNPYENPELLNA